VLSAEHCRVRAERFRFWLLTAPDHATAARLRGFIERYNALAKRAEKAEALRFAAGAAQFQDDPDEFLEKPQASSRKRDNPPSLTQHLPTLSAAHYAESASTEISSTDPGMTIVGETANVFGRVEGEVCRPIVWISGGGQLEGVVVAQELTVGGRFKGTIHANRVTLATSAVVEGEIFYRSLAVDANAWFAGLSRPEQNLMRSWTTTHVKDVPSLPQHPFKRFLKKKEDKMFGKSKGSSGEPLPAVPQLQNPATVGFATLDTTDDSMSSSIGPGMTVVGKISSEGAVNVFGRVEGELHASIVRISDGGQVEGIVAAQELSVGGHFKGTIHANRVALTSTAVVEGEIFHRCLVIEENAWFSGVSHPGESLVDASASAQVNVAPSPSQYAHNGNAQINGPLEKEVGADTPVLPRPSSP